jgi:hypothetical protein
MNCPYFIEICLNSLMAEVDRINHQLYLGHEGWLELLKESNQAS